MDTIKCFSAFISFSKFFIVNSSLLIIIKSNLFAPFVLSSEPNKNAEVYEYFVRVIPQGVIQLENVPADISERTVCRLCFESEQFMIRVQQFSSKTSSSNLMNHM